MDRSLYYDDIRGARPKFLYPAQNRQFPYGEVYQQNLQNANYGRNMYQSQMLAVPEQVAPQGVGYFRLDGRKHFPEIQRGEIDQYKALQNIFDPPKWYAGNYDRSLLTKDIDGAVTNTLISKVVKNKELASVYQRDVQKPKSVYEPNSQESPDYHSRKNYIDNQYQYQNQYQNQNQNHDLSPGANYQQAQNQELYKNKSSVSLASDEQKRRYLEQLQQENMKYKEERRGDERKSNHQDERRSNQAEERRSNLGDDRRSHHQEDRRLDERKSHPEERRKSIPEDNRRLEDQRQMEMHWEQQRLEHQQRQQELQRQKELEFENQKKLEEKAIQAFEEQRKLEQIQKNKYASELNQQVQKLQAQQNQTPPAIPKSTQINQLLQYPRMQKSQGEQKEALESLLEEQKQQVMINRFRPHELQQYIYDLKNGKLPSKTRNTPTFMSYAGQVLDKQS